jgi:putative ABC transport system ATP-binding protein
MERQVMELLSEINRERGTTVIQVTHSEAVAAYGSRIIRIRDGEIVE